ncbi:hypothetical protein IAT38_000377 [Cryptococcus sp. DSM 104549]
MPTAPSLYSPETAEEKHSTVMIEDMREEEEPSAFQTRQAASTLVAAAADEHSTTTIGAMKAHWRAVGWCLYISIGALLWGYDVQVAGGMLSVPSFRRDFGYELDGVYVLPARWQSAFNSVSSVGMMFGGLLVGWLSDRIGRRGTTGIACLISIVGVLLQFLTPEHNNTMLVMGKLINGLALGMYVSSAAGYCAELSPLPLRGLTTGSINLWIVIGQFLGNCVLKGTGSRTDRYSYRIPFALQWLFPLLLCVGLPFAPESPWYLVRLSRMDEARRVLTLLGSKDVDLNIQQIKETIDLEDLYATQASYLGCFKGTSKQRTVIALMVFVLQQFAGIVFVVGYSTFLFQLAGFDTSKSFKLGVGVSAVGVAGNLVALFTVNKLGRRFIFFWGMVMCGVLNLVLGVASIPKTSAAKWVAAGTTIVYNFAYQGGIGPLGYVIFAEVGSAKLRSKTVGIGICVNSLGSLLANIAIPYLVNPDEANLAGKVGFVFAGLSLLGIIWTWLYIPETKNRTVDELDALFEARVPPRHFEKTKIN